jgi:hypothetical protein
MLAIAIEKEARNIVTKQLKWRLELLIVCGWL